MAFRNVIFLQNSSLCQTKYSLYCKENISISMGKRYPLGLQNFQNEL